MRKHRVNTRGTCRDCKLEQPVGKMAWKKAARPRCIACGGSLDETGIWKGKTQCFTPVPSTEWIEYPDKPSEFEIQAYVYWKLKEAGHDVRGCVGTKTLTDVFDIVFFDDGRPKRIIEVKKHAKSSRARRLARGNTRDQVERYKEFGIPVDLITGMEAAIKYVLAFQDLIENAVPIIT